MTQKIRIHKTVDEIILVYLPDFFDFEREVCKILNKFVDIQDVVKTLDDTITNGSYKYNPYVNEFIKLSKEERYAYITNMAEKYVRGEYGNLPRIKCVF